MSREQFSATHTFELAGKATIFVGRVLKGAVSLMAGDPTTYQNEFGHLGDSTPDANKNRRVGQFALGALVIGGSVASERWLGVNPIDPVIHTYNNIRSNSSL